VRRFRQSIPKRRDENQTRADSGLGFDPRAGGGFWLTGYNQHDFEQIRNCGGLRRGIIEDWAEAGWHFYLGKCFC
jgi:hypothetical protein